MKLKEAISVIMVAHQINSSLSSCFEAQKVWFVEQTAQAAE